MAARDLLFVYGTLLTTANHPIGEVLRAHALFVGKGSFQGRLFWIKDPDDPRNHYPGALPSGNPADRVFGEVYQLMHPEKVLPVLDRYEACSPDWPEPYEFLRRNVAVTLEKDDSVIRCWTYLYTWDVSRARLIPSGRFTGPPVDADDAM